MHRNPLSFASESVWTLLCSMKSSALQRRPKDIQRQVQAERSDPAGPEQKQVLPPTLAVCRSYWEHWLKWFLCSLETKGSFLTTPDIRPGALRHTQQPGSLWSTHSLPRAAKVILTDERQEGQTAAVQELPLEFATRKRRLFAFHFECWPRKERHDFTIHTFFFFEK